MRFSRTTQTIATCLCGFIITAESQAFDDKSLHSFFENHCYECHDDASEKGGLDLYSLSTDLTDPGTMQKWVRIFDRVAEAEMPPEDEPQPNASERAAFTQLLRQPLTSAHAEAKGTVLRRLNRQEYENTLNDLFGTNLKLVETLPEDGRAHGFDTVGEALGLLVKGGHMMNMGLSGRETTLALDPICMKELRISSGFASTPRSWRRAMGWLHSGVLQLEPLVTDVLPVNQWQTGFDRSFAADGIKFVLDPRL